MKLLSKEVESILYSFVRMKDWQLMTINDKCFRKGQMILHWQLRVYAVIDHDFEGS